MTKEQLRNYLSIKAERAQIQALLDEMEAALCSPATPQLTGLPGAAAEDRVTYPVLHTVPEQICVEMDYSWRQIHRIHAGALEQLKGH